MARSPVRALTMVVASLTAIATATWPTSVSAGSTPAAPAASGLPPGMVAALGRDLGLTSPQATAALAAQRAAGRVERRLRAELGTGFAGAWLEPAGRQLVVAVTDPAGASRARVLGAQPRLVTRSAATLAAARARLDRTPAPASVSSWYVDAATNSVVVRAEPAAMPAARAFVRASGADPTAVRFEVGTERVVELGAVRGGDIYYDNSLGSCSIGFSVTRISNPAVGGYVTAGHCGAVGTPTLDGNFSPLGTVAGTWFPGRDQGWVQVGPEWTPQPLVNTYGGGDLAVTGWNEAPVGAFVCRSGQRTGWRCGTIQARNVTVSADSGTVVGLARTNACAEPGDSGGPFVAGQDAQGVTSRGSGNCSTGGTTYFQPVVTALDQFDLRLATAGGGPTAPIIFTLECERTGGFFCDLGEYHPDPVQIRWTLNGTPISSWDDLHHITGGCGGRSSVTITATVSNGSGSDSDSEFLSCSIGPR